MIFRSSSLIVTMLAVAVAAVGCGGGGGEADTGTEPAVDIRSVGPVDRFALPLDPYRITVENQLIARNAMDVLHRKCMKRFGFDIALPPAAGVELIKNSRRYGIGSADYAQSYGYHLADMSNPARDAVRKRVVPEAENAVSRGLGIKTYNGQEVPEGGCAGEATRALEDGLPTVPDERLGDKLSAAAFQSSKRDSRVGNAVAQWSRCMKESGYEYASPLDAMDDAAFSGAEIAAAEIKTATTDVACKEKTRLLDVWGSVETAYQQVAIDRNAEDLRRLRDRLTARVTLATKTLNEAGAA